MTVCGITAEYNPFHTGHLHHIAETRRSLGENAVIVCVMSGNFVQRGDFAVLDKYARAEMAVRCGADLVVELPLAAALSSAEGFAKGAVQTLHALGCGTVSFGAETADTDLLLQAAELLNSLPMKGESGSPHLVLRRQTAGGISESSQTGGSSFRQPKQHACRGILPLPAPARDASTCGAPAGRGPRCMRAAQRLCLGESAASAFARRRFRVLRTVPAACGSRRVEEGRRLR